MSREKFSTTIAKLKVDRVDGTFGPSDELRVLMVDSDYIIVFKPQAGRDSVSNIKRFLKGDAHEFETTQ